MRHLVITRSHKIIGEKSRQDFEIFVVEGPRRSLCSDNRAPDGKKLEGENRLRIRFSPSKVGPKISLCSDNRVPEWKKLGGEKRIRIRFSPSRVGVPKYRCVGIIGFQKEKNQKAKNDYVFVFRLLGWVPKYRCVVIIGFQNEKRQKAKNEYSTYQFFAFQGVQKI